MSFTIEVKTQLKKDLKKIKSDTRKMDMIKILINEYLIVNGTVPSEYKPHPLQGSWRPAMECHVFPDLLLIWYVDYERKVITLARCGTHSNIFG